MNVPATKDNPAWEYAAAHASTEPDIYFDEKEFEENYHETRTDAVTNIRLIFGTCLEAARGDIRKLHTIMGTMAGLSFREVSRLSGISHEGVRLHLEQIRITHPALHEVLVRSGKARVDALIPTLANKRWRITPPVGRPFYIAALRPFCEAQGWSYRTIWPYRLNRKPYRGYLIERVIAEQR